MKKLETLKKEYEDKKLLKEKYSGVAALGDSVIKAADKYIKELEKPYKKSKRKFRLSDVPFAAYADLEEDNRVLRKNNKEACDQRHYYMDKYSDLRKIKDEDKND